MHSDDPDITTLSDRIGVQTDLPGIVLQTEDLALGLSEVEASRLQTLLTERGYGESSDHDGTA